MQEVKFRGKRVDNGKWVYGDLRQFINGTMCPVIDWGLGCANVHLDSVGQFTGWQTKPNPDQKDIYSGDLFSVDDEGICEVEFRHGSWYLGDELLYEYEESNGLIGWGSKLEGNTTDNPELLGDSK